MQTRSQRYAQAAYKRVTARVTTNDKGKKVLEDKYETLAKKFPALIHTCGLAQAVAFAEAKGASKDQDKPKPELQYIHDLAAVLNAGGHTEIMDAKVLAQQSRDVALGGYLRLSRDALQAASWLKRYVEALAGEEE